MTARDNHQQTILWVDLSSGSTQLETLPEAWTAKYLGCRGVNARLLFDHVPAGTDPLGPDNVLFFGTGPLDGLPVGMGRISIACKSPRGIRDRGHARARLNHSCYHQSLAPVQEKRGQRVAYAALRLISHLLWA